MGVHQQLPIFHTVDYVWRQQLQPGRMAIVTLEWEYPATPEQREEFRTKVRGVFDMTFPERFRHESHSIRSEPTPSRPPPMMFIQNYATALVRGPQKRPDGEEVERALLFQPWEWRLNDLSAEEEFEVVKGWLSGMVGRLGLMGISNERYDIYPI